MEKFGGYNLENHNGEPSGRQWVESPSGGGVTTLPL